MVEKQRRINSLLLLRQRRRREFLAEIERSRISYRRRRKAFVAFIVAVANAATPTVRRMWTRDRAHCFWSTIQHLGDEQWKAHFRMTRETFDYLVELLAPAITRQTTNLRTPIEPRRRVAIALWWLATSGEYRTIACLFGVGLSTVCNIVRQVTNALVDTLHQRFISLPTGQRLDATIAGFVERGYPQCAGAIDGTHIPIIAPRDNPEDYHNRKGWYSIILQAVVDHNFCFTDVYVGCPGRTPDDRVFANSDLFKLAEAQQHGYLFPREKSTVVDGVEIPVHLIGDAAYPLKKWLMKGFTQHHQLSKEQAHYTNTLSSARMVVENALGRLKGRWRCLMKRNDIDLAAMSNVVAACCILHNVCEIQKDNFLPEWNPVPEEETVLQPHAEIPETERLNRAQLIRSTVAANLAAMLEN
uniref:Protein ALP1-like n=2 Tax=Hippocampus comes TaxID=109280 RepID=A0A3Q2YLC0_HIPCM